MLVFRCFDCNKIWTKFVDDGCRNCGMPCEVIVWELDINETANQTYSRIAQDKEKILETEVQDQVEPKNASSNADYRPRRLYDFDTGDRLGKVLDRYQSEQPSRSGLLGHGLSASLSAAHRARKFSTDSGVSLASTVEYSSGSSDTTSVQDIHELDHDNSRDDTALKVVYERDDSKILTSTAPTETNQNKKNKKKNKCSRTYAKNKSKRAAFTDTKEKFIAQLELPDPIPSPKIFAPSRPWSQVLNQQTAKRSAKIKTAAHKGREVNGSPSLARQTYDDENESYSARVVAFGLRGAKHSIKSTVPRETFDF